MERLPVSELMPGVYRAVLDTVAELEHRGRRREAAAIRAEATRVYSTAWNAGAYRRLRTLQARAARVFAQHHSAGTDGVLESRSRPVDLEHRTA